MRCFKLIALTVLAALPGPLAVRAQSEQPANPFHNPPAPPHEIATSPEATEPIFDESVWPPPDPAANEAFQIHEGPEHDIPERGIEHGGMTPELLHEPGYPPPSYRPIISWLNLRHSYTHGRNVGLGGPLVGSSWINRPYYVGADLGNLWMTNRVNDSVGRDVDAFGGIFLGCDWDHYWGNELAFHWATPELKNRQAPSAHRTDSLFIWSYNLMYYPWGDATLRPYWRWGIGNTHIDFPRDDGTRYDDWLLTFPIGIGVKYPVRRWLAARAELTDQLSAGGNGVPTQNNLTLTLGLEWRFGAHPRSYWPWHPSRHIW